MKKILLITLLFFSGCIKKNKTESETKGVYIQNCPAPEAERLIWRQAFNSYVAIKLLDNYMDCSGLAVRLSKQEMVDLHPRISIRYNEKIAALIESEKFEDRELEFETLAVAYGGTLGQFTAKIRGKFYVPKPHTWEFVGTVRFEDWWDFDPQPDGVRMSAGEYKTRVAHNVLSGVDFRVFSEETEIRQRHDSKYAWLEGLRPSIPEPDYSTFGKIFGDQDAKLRGKDIKKER